MSKNEREYIRLCKYILKNGIKKEDRTGTGTISIFGYQMRFNLQEGFPLLTTKKINFLKVLGEYLAFLHGETNANTIAEKYGFKTWKLWADENGDLGPIYGKQWRSWEANGKVIDQFNRVIEEIRSFPNSRRLIVSAWNVADLDRMALPPCHTLFQFYVSEGKLSLQLYQRSADVFLGLPFNIAGYSTILMIVATMTGLEPYEFIHTIGDAHIYLNHVEQIKKQIKRKPRPLPTLKVRKRERIDDYWFDDFELIGYNPHPPINGEVSV